MKPDSQLANTLRALRAAGPRGCTGHDLYLAGGGHRYSARADDLRALGYDIPDATYEGKTADGKSIYRFVLLSEPTSPRSGTRSTPSGRDNPPGPAFGVPDLEGVDTLFQLEPPRKSAITGGDVQEAA